MADEQPSIRPLRLINIFNQVPEVADLVIKHLDPDETITLLTRTDPALKVFCEGAGGGLDRLMAISEVGTKERRRIRKLPSFPRLLIGEWQKKLMGKRLIEEGEEGDDTVCSFTTDFAFQTMKVLVLFLYLAYWFARPGVILELSLVLAYF